MNWKDGPLAQTWIPVLHNTEWANGIPENLLARQCYQESRFNPKALNKKSGCVGLMQLFPKDFPGAGVNPVKDIRDGGNYLLKLFHQFGNWQAALAAYDWGPGNLRRWEHAGSHWPDLPEETQAYVLEIITDVPVEGPLCKIQNLGKTVPLKTRPLPEALPAVPSSGQRLPSSWWESLVTFLKPPLIHKSQEPSPPSLSTPLPTLSPIENPKELEMNDVEQKILAAAVPALNNVLDAIAQFGVDIGPDPEKYKLTLLPAAQKLLGSVELQIPVVVTAEGGQVQGLIQTKAADLKTKLAAFVASTQPKAAIVDNGPVTEMPMPSKSAG